MISRRPCDRLPIHLIHASLVGVVMPLMRLFC
jgi:hypothetical protein